jgi:putative selenate reductase
MKFNDKFYPTPLKDLLEIILTQLNNDNEVLGLNKKLFFAPKKNDFFKTTYLNQKLDSPIGVAAGPQTQLAQNIIISWLAGARFIELKTIQTLDELEIPKPCIDMQDEGYNCEWSQELKIKQAFNEYLNAWIIIHILQNELKINNLATIFNMSVGYDMQGILKNNVQWFLDKMSDASDELNSKLLEIKKIYPKIDNIKIPKQICNNITLSTMHGCPPQEIEQIASYLIEKRKLHTIIKLNPTLLGKEKLLKIIKNSGFKTQVPDIAFEHDLKYEDATKMITRLLEKAEKNNVFFGIKLTNTLETINNKNIFDKTNQMMYMSGKALHPISINIAKKIQNDFNGQLNISFSGGADAFNISNLIYCGLKPITISSDLLKPGGYGRLKQYYDNLRKYNSNIKSIEQFITEKSLTKSTDINKNALENLNTYANEVLEDKRYKKNSFSEPSIKTNTELNKFDCIAAPCQTTCPTNQNVPQYMYSVQNKQLNNAIQTILDDNPFPTVTGYICDHTCQLKCTRINYDDSLNIREIKRYIAQKAQKNFKPTIKPQANTAKVAIIGAGPAGLSAAYYLKINGFYVEIFEKNNHPGGMIANAIPPFRLQDKQVDIDIQTILNLNIKINFNSEITIQNFDKLRNSFEFVFVAPGAQASMKLNIPGSNAIGILDPLDFFFKTRQNPNLNIGKNVAIIGGGNTAMDAARIAKRLVGKNGKVTILYRRTKDFMPAHYHEIIDTLNEGIEILECVEPEKFITENNKLKSVVLYKTKLIHNKNQKRPQPMRINESRFEMNFDTIIPAIGQKNNFNFLDEDSFKKQKIPFTKYENIFIGGDAVRGAASAIKAIADGKNTAYEIIRRKNPDFKPQKLKINKKISYDELKIKKATRIYQTKTPQLDLNNRNNFDIVNQTYSDEQAKNEADRCLLCDELCDVCISVCPNLANQGYWVEPFSVILPKIIIQDKKTKIIQDKKFEIKQNRQTYNIADWCNECGNCQTFCPTAGKPYLDKPKIHISQKSFDQSPYGYKIEKQNKKIIVKYKDKEMIRKLTIENNTLFYTDKYINAKLDTKFNILEFNILEKKDEIKFDKTAEMFVISHIKSQKKKNI